MAKRTLIRFAHPPKAENDGKIECKRHKTGVVKSDMLSICYRTPETLIAESFDLFFRLFFLLSREVPAG